MKKVLSLLLAVTLVLSMVPMMAVSADTVMDEYFYKYVVENGEAIITGVDGIYIENTDGYIPAFLGGYPVTKIKELDGAYAFTAVIVPEGVREIAGHAFSNCSNATTIHIPSTVESVGTHIGFPTWNAKLESITVAQDNPYYTSVDGVLFTKDKKTLLRCPVAKTGTFTIPSGVKTIEINAFYNCSKLTGVTIPNSVTEIKNDAFENCASLKTVTLPNSVTTMGHFLFAQCTSLKTATLPKNTTYIPNSMFAGCAALTKVNYGSSVNEIGTGAFNGCSSLTSILLNAAEYSIIPHDTFAGCTSLKTVLYGRSKEDRANLDICPGNESLTKATWKYNYCTSGKGHKFDYECDTACNRCGMTRNPSHRYKLTATTKGTFSKNGKAVGKCVHCGKSMGTSMTVNKIKSVKLAATSYTYNGKAKKPTVTVKDAKGNTIPIAYYTVKYVTGCKNVGKHKVTVTFKGLYSGKKTLYFTINPVKTSVKSVSAAKKSLKVKLTKKTTQTTGYQIQYATSSKFKSAKTKTVSNKTTSVTLKSLKAKKTYYVRVRTYKSVNGKKYYSAWSASKKKKTK